MRPLMPFLLACAMAAPVQAEPVAARNGTDSYLAGPAGLPALDAPGDVFAAGSSVMLRGTAVGDVHAMGFTVEVEMPVPQDLYAAGGSVTVRGPVGSDLTAGGFSVRTAAEVGGNARLAGGSVVVDAPVRGSLTATGGEVTLNATVEGDVLVETGKLTLGPDARIGGRLIYSAPEATVIPVEVIPPGRVTFRRSGTADDVDRWRDTWPMHSYPVLPGFLAIFSTALIVLGFLVAIGAACLLIAPTLTERLRQSAAAEPGAALLSGFLGLATLFGAIPVAVLTIVGIPLLPFALLLILVTWTLGYLLGAYVIAHRAMLGLGAYGAGVLSRLAALAAVLAILTVLNFIPFLGWILNVALMLFGLGAIARPIFARFGAALPPATAEPALP